MESQEQGRHWRGALLDSVDGSIDPSQVLFEVSENHHFDDAGLRRLLLESVIVVFTKDGVQRLRATLLALLNQPAPVVLLDDSTTQEAVRWVSSNAKSLGAFYHGAAQQERVLAFPELAPLKEFVPRLGQGPWQLGRCRSYAVILAKACGFKHLLMMDDDIVVDNLQIIRTLSLLEEYGIVGARTARMPDDSVVGHMKRAVGLESVSFVSGQYLGVDLSGVRYSFPDIYNEDWIFALLHSNRTQVARFSSVEQLACDPFGEAVEKAIFQEPGEIACDGVIGAVLRRNVRALTSKDYWRRICAERREDLETLSARVEDHPRSDVLRETLRAVLAYHDRVAPEGFRHFFFDYEAVQSDWRKGLAQLAHLELSLKDIAPG